MRRRDVSSKCAPYGSSTPNMRALKGQRYSRASECVSYLVRVESRLRARERVLERRARIIMMYAGVQGYLLKDLGNAARAKTELVSAMQQ
eukprot:19214-Heterococcus_DN1.PRE.5